MEKKEQQRSHTLDIELDEQVAQGTYVNLVIISHSPSEFILDFVRVVPGLPKAKVKTRLIMTPDHVKRFLLALQENVRRYENEFGAITLKERPSFQGPHIEA